ncbi:MAG: hypothetical protein ACYTGC_02255 [Planctomycetota bacterium]|jgi:hypothetical protein
MNVHCLLAAALVAAAPGGLSAASGQAVLQAVIDELNGHPTVNTTDDAKSYRIIFDAYLELGAPPRQVGPDFNLTTIHPAMSGWGETSNWAESNADMAEALLEARDKTLIGLPYGRDSVSPAYQDKGVYVDIGRYGNLRDIDFRYLEAVDTISAFATAEVYRLMEAGAADEGLDLALAHIFVLRQLCDREFLDEKLYSIELLSEALANLRDVFYLYIDSISSDRFSDIAWFEMPFLRPDRGRLFMPEADRVVSEALINDVFDKGSGAPNAEKFARAFAAIQSADQPLTRFGAARRWAMIAEVHGSLDASLERLELVYDDWWRRWRVQEYDPILDVPDQFSRTNSVRYAAVLFSMQDLEELFPVRNQLIAEVNGTAMAAGLCAYKRSLGRFPGVVVNVYAQFVRKSSDTDPFDQAFGRFRYRLLDSREAVDTPAGRVWIEADEALLYSVGQNHQDDRARSHTNTGSGGDKVIWPPMRVLARQQGLIQ